MFTKHNLTVFGGVLAFSAAVVIANIPPKTTTSPVTPSNLQTVDNTSQTPDPSSSASPAPTDTPQATIAPSDTPTPSVDPTPAPSVTPTVTPTPEPTVVSFTRCYVAVADPQSYNPNYIQYNHYTIQTLSDGTTVLNSGELTAPIEKGEQQCPNNQPPVLQ